MMMQSAHPPAYQTQGSPQTLAEGLAEYGAVYAEQLSTRLLSDEGRAFFRSHDAVHVLFGCGLSLRDEVVVKITSLFGTTGGFAVLRGYRLPESQEIYTEIGLLDILHTAAISLLLVPKTLFRCARMRTRWPWRDFEAHLDTSLTELRAEFGIRVARQ